MVDDEELEKLKEERKNQLQSDDQDVDTEEQAEQQKQRIWDQAKQYMSSEAVSRLGNIKTVDEEKALAVARQITRLGEMGQIENISEEKMKDILRSIQQEKESSKSNIKFRK